MIKASFLSHENIFTPKPNMAPCALSFLYSLRSTHETGNGASRTGEGRAGGGAEEERRCGGADDVGTPAVGAEARPLLEESRERLLVLVVSGLMGCLHGLNLLDTNYKRFKGFSGK